MTLTIDVWAGAAEHKGDARDDPARDRNTQRVVPEGSIDRCLKDGSSLFARY